jgi:D-alanine-D-alanine ligase
VGRRKTRVLVVYNFPWRDVYEDLRRTDPARLEFEPVYEVHVQTAREEYDAIVDALDDEGYSASAVNVRDSLSRLTTLLRRDPPDVVFNLVETFRDEARLEHCVAALFELAGVTYTGASPLALATCRRKVMTKQLMRASGVPTPAYLSIDGPGVPRRFDLRFPLIVKPAREDASNGVDAGAVVHDRRHLILRVRAALADYAPPVLVEEYIEGRELHVSILGNDPPEVLPILEYDFSELPSHHPRIISYDIKWSPLEEEFHRVHEVCPARLAPALERRVRAMALAAYDVTACRDYARLDIRMGRDGQPHVLEVNPNPDLSAGVSFMRSAEEAGLSFGQTLSRIVACALARAPASARRSGRKASRKRSR